MRSNKSYRIGVRLSKIQLRALNEYCKAHNTTKSKIVQNVANKASQGATFKIFKEISPVNHIKNNVVDSNSKVISAIDKIYRTSKARYRQTAGIAENINQIARALNQDYKLTPQQVTYLNELLKVSNLNRNDDSTIAKAFGKLEKEMT